MERRPSVAAASLLVLFACGGDDTLPTSNTPPATAGRPARGAGAPAAGPAVEVDPAIPAWEPAADLSGALAAGGSDTMKALMAGWAEALTGGVPGLKVKVEAGGSAAAPAALADGSVQLAASSRPMTAAEVGAFRKKHGYEPTEVKVALDALSVFVHKDNPIDKLTIAQVDAIFSSTRKHGAPKEVRTWGDLGLTGDWAARPIALHGRGATSGTRAFFKEHALKNGEFRDNVSEHAGSAEVTQAVAADVYAMGYAGMGARRPAVKPVPLVAEDGHASPGSYEDVVKRSYPLSRYLYVSVDRAAGQPLDPLRAEFLKLVLSRQGQEAVVKAGYLPLTAELVQQERAKLQ